MKNQFLIGLTGSIILFLIVILGVVFYTTTLSFGLVTKDYYSEELQYQKQIDRQINEKNSEIKLQIQYNMTKGVIIQIDPVTSAITGTVLLYRPSNPDLDVMYELKLDSEKRVQIISVNNLANGKWIVQIMWKYNGQELYTEEDIFLQN